MTQYVWRNLCYCRVGALLCYVQQCGAGCELAMHQAYYLDSRSPARQSVGAVGKHAVHRQKPMDQRAGPCQGGGLQMGLLHEDSCRQRIEQGEEEGQALTEPSPTYINGD